MHVLGQGIRRVLLTITSPTAAHTSSIVCLDTHLVEARVGKCGAGTFDAVFAFDRCGMRSVPENFPTTLNWKRRPRPPLCAPGTLDIKGREVRIKLCES
ncbi:hypothetical protein C8Q77DRAFT_801620 [Trametes polyzona]|nr:hypothetical protein C8Q77DRAFT_801620 [Trametes polyzona]